MRRESEYSAILKSKGETPAGIGDLTRAEEMERGRRVKLQNAIAAASAGGALILLAKRYFTPPSTLLGVTILVRASAGLLLGVLYANAFEYVLHRFLLHKGEGFLDMRHGLHHDSAGAPEEARYVNFARSPLVVVLVFVLNAIPVVLLECFLRLGIAAGVFLGFTIYFIAYEEIHWRIHFGPLPRRMIFARRHHMLHHGGFPGRYNVFLPLFDWLFSSAEGKRERA